MRASFLTALSILSKPLVAIGGALVIGAGILLYVWYGSAVVPQGVVVSVTEGPITQEVDVSGVVQAAHSTDLAFQTSGRIAQVSAAVGDHVYAGEVLSALDTSAQSAALALAKANVEAAQARLAALRAGTRPEQLAINQTAVTQAQSALSNAAQSAYTSADDAIHAKVDQIFTNPRNATAQVAFPVADATLVNTVQSERVALEGVLSSWRAALSASSTTAEAQATLSAANVSTVLSFLDDVTKLLTEAQPGGTLTSAALVGYQTSINTGRLNVSGARTGLIAADTAYKSAVGALTLAQSGATQNDIDAQVAAVDAAQAALASAQAGAAQAVIVAPVAGVITAQNANLGATAVPGVPLISMIADGKYQVVASVAETDITKIHLHDPVQVTFDAFPGAVFDAVVTTVSPAALVTGGVSSYSVTATFEQNDARLVAGLSANMRIITAAKQDVLSVPTSAIIRAGDAQFVYVKAPDAPRRVPVTTGIVSADGRTEILTGLSAGDQVLSYGTAAP